MSLVFHRSADLYHRRDLPKFLGGTVLAFHPVPAPVLTCTVSVFQVEPPTGGPGVERAPREPVPPTTTRPEIVMTNADDRIAAQIAEAARRRQAAQERRAALNRARQAGLAKRHATRLRMLAQREQQGDPPAVTGHQAAVHTRARETTTKETP